MLFFKMLKEECSKDKFRLTHSHPEDFTMCFWQNHAGVSPYWVVYRVTIVLYFTIALLLVYFTPAEGFVWYKNAMYYTYWSYFVELTALFLCLIVTVMRFRKEKKEEEIPPMEKMPVLYSILWCAYTIAAPSSVVVTLIFWLFVYNPDVYSNLSQTFVTHVFNSVFMVLDFFLYACPYRFLHFYLPVSFSLLYGFFSLAYQLSGGTGNKGQIPIYTILDWREPKMALTTCAIHIFCIVLVHCAFCVINLLKHWMKKTPDSDT